MVYRVFVLSIFVALSTAILSCGPSAKKKDSASELPEWVNSYNKFYPESKYIVSLGVSQYKGMAENQAFQGIASAFEIMIKSSQDSKELTFESGDDFDQSYREVFKINTSTSQNLKNIKTSESFYDQKHNKYYVLATLNKSETASLYKQERDQLHRDSEKAFKLFVQETDDLLKLAHISSSISYLSEVEEIDLKLRILEDSRLGLLKHSDLSDLYLHRKKLLENIKLFIAENDPRIHKYLMTEFTSMGMMVVADQQQARLKISHEVSLENSNVPNNDAKFVNWSLSVEIFDLLKESSIAHYSSNGRSSQLNENAAIERAYFDIDKKLQFEFKSFLIKNILKVENSKN